MRLTSSMYSPPGSEFGEVEQTFRRRETEPALLKAATIIFAFLVALCVIGLGAPRASAEPATFSNHMKCGAKYPGSKLDIGTGQCWSCPSSAPKRTIFAVDGPKACEKPAYEDFKKATGPTNPTGGLIKKCASDAFMDILKGKCYSCGDYNRSTYPVTHARACSKVIKVSRKKATLHGKSGCEPGSWQHGLTGSCYTCPTGSKRNLKMGQDPQEFEACSSPADKARNPFTLYNRTDEPLSYSVALFEEDPNGMVEMLVSGTVPAGERHAIDMAGNDCDASKRDSTNPGVVLSALTQDSCFNEKFTVFLWSSEKNLAQYEALVSGTDLYAQAVGEFFGDGLGLAEAGAKSYANWVFHQAYNEGGLLKGAGVRNIIFDISQNDRWIAYWGARIPVEVGKTGDTLGDPRQLANPCARQGQTSLQGPDGIAVLVNPGVLCGEAPVPG